MFLLYSDATYTLIAATGNLLSYQSLLFFTHETHLARYTVFPILLPFIAKNNINT